VNQLEVHPFLDPQELQPLLQFCRMQMIPVEAHSVLMRGLYWSNPKLIAAALDSNLTQAQYLVAWAASQIGVDGVCISSTSNEHLQELLSSPIFDDPLPPLLDIKRFRLYPFSDVLSSEMQLHQLQQVKWNVKDLTETILNDLLLLKNVENMGSDECISDVCLMIPSVKSKYSELGRDMARTAYPQLDGDERKFARFDSLTKPLRVYCYDRYKEIEESERKKTLSVCCVTKKIKNFDDQISDAIINPTPMPVDISEKETLEPFFHYLSSNETFVGDKEFFKGAVIEKRMDMCKQVTGPDHIEDLCVAVSKNTQIRHFLLGNNIAFRGDQEKAKAMADVMKSNQAIETWYLAGNYIGPQGTKLLCLGLKTNTTCKSLWLKRNPIGKEGAKYLHDMLACNQNMKLLDLDNCGLLDEGVEALFGSDSDDGGDGDDNEDNDGGDNEDNEDNDDDNEDNEDNDDGGSSQNNLQHIYLDANGITPRGATFIARWCKEHKDTIKSLYVSINRLGNEGVRDICDALHGSKSLKRISFGSNRLTDDIANHIVDFALSCEKLICLGLGCYKSTFDMGEKPNFFSRVDPFLRLVQNHSSLLYLDLLMNSFPKEDVIRLIQFAKECTSKLTIDASQITTKPEDKKSLFLNAYSDRNKLKFVKHPKKVLHIDSIYRNRM
jgi:hypothetical protein